MAKLLKAAHVMETEAQLRKEVQRGWTVTGDLIGYYLDGSSSGISVNELRILKTMSGKDWNSFKETLIPVKKRKTELPDPCLEVNFGGWSSGYQNAFDNANIDYLSAKRAYRDWDRKEERMNKRVTFKIPLDADSLPDKESKFWETVSLRTDGFALLMQYDYYVPVPTDKTPMYIPRYMTIKPDVATMHHFGKMVMTVPDSDYKEFLDTYLELVQYSYDYVLSSGNFISQVGRILKGFKVYNDTMKLTKNLSRNGLAEAVEATLGIKNAFLSGQRLREPQITQEAYNAIMMLRAPFRKREQGLVLSITNILALSVATQINCRNGFSLFKVNKDSTAGLWMQNETKDVTFPTDVTMAKWLLDKLASFCVGGTFDHEKFALFMEQYGGLFIPETKNKMEVGLRKKLKEDKVWRNYFVFNNWIQLPGQILLQHIYKVAPDVDKRVLHKNYENPEIWSLLGWSPYHYGVYNLLRTMVKESKDYGYSIAVYSDNLYLMQYLDGEFYWYSLDGSSMEVSIDHQDAVYFMKHTLDNFWNGEISDPWRVYGEVFYPKVNINGRALLGNMQWQNVGMFSGQGGTAYLNNAKMITAATSLDHKMKGRTTRKLLVDDKPLPDKDTTIEYGERLLAPELDQCFYTRGISLKVEVVTHSTWFKYLAEEGEMEPPSREDETVRLDLLGYDGIFCPRFFREGLIKPFPILTEKKLKSSFVFNKQKTQESHAVNRVLSISRYKAFYILGCWKSLPLSALIRNRIASYEVDLTISTLDEPEKLVEEIIASVAKGLSMEAASAIATALDSFRLPSIFDLLNIYANADFAGKFITSVIENEGPTHALIYANPAVVVDFLFDWLEQCMKEGKEEVELTPDVEEFIVTVGKSPSANEIAEMVEKKNPLLAQKVISLLRWEGALAQPREVSNPKRKERPQKKFSRPTQGDTEWPSVSSRLQLLTREPLPRPFSFGRDIPEGELCSKAIECIQKVDAYVKENDIKIGELFDYALWFKGAGVTKEDVAEIKVQKQTALFLKNLDRKLLTQASKRLDSTAEVTPEGKELEKREVVLRRLDRKIEKHNKKEAQRKATEAREAEIKERTEAMKKERQKEKKRLKEREKEKAKEKEKEKEKEEAFSLTLEVMVNNAKKSPLFQPSGERRELLFQTVKRKIDLTDPKYTKLLSDIELGHWAVYMKHEEDYDEFLKDLIILVINYRKGNADIKTGMPYQAAVEIQRLVKDKSNLSSMRLIL